MKKYLLIGKSEQVRSSFRRDPATGKFVQFKIGRGMKIELNEDEMTFHVQRQAGFGILKIVEIEEPEPEVKAEPIPEPIIEWPDSDPEEDTPVVEETKKPAPKKRRSRLKKAVDLDE